MRNANLAPLILYLILYSEYIRDLIRREQDRGAWIEVVLAALIEGEASCEPRPFDACAFRQRMLASHG